jgi:hypothetical protein
MYENGKMRPVETIPGMQGGGYKGEDGDGEFSMTYCKNICKCHSVPPPSTIKKERMTESNIKLTSHSKLPKNYL